MSLLATDALLIAMGVFLGAALTAASAGEWPIEFMGLTPWKETTLMGTASVGAFVLWNVLFHPALLVAVGAPVGMAFMTNLAEGDVEQFMDDPHPSRMAVYAFVGFGLTLAAWLVA